MSDETVYIYTFTSADIGKHLPLVKVVDGNPRIKDFPIGNILAELGQGKSLKKIVKEKRRGRNPPTLEDVKQALAYACEICCRLGSFCQKVESSKNQEP